MGRWSVGVTLVLVACHSGEPFDFGATAPSGDNGSTDAESVSDSMSGTPAPADGALALPTNEDPPSQPAPRGRPGPSVSDPPDAAVAAKKNLAGSACEQDAACATGHCSNGVCCNRSCDDCETCSSEGRCVVLAECAFSSCDAGLCRPARGPLGARCEDGTGAECESGFCVDGVCCESGCDGVCQQCSAQGFCNVFPALDTVCADVTCPEDTLCRTHVPVEPRACASFGRCAGPEDCLVRNARLGVLCDTVASRCDGHGNCQRITSAPAYEPTQACPQAGGGPQEIRVPLDGDPPDCWVGETWETGFTHARGSIRTGPDGPGSVTLGAFLFQPTSAKTQAFDAEGVLLPGCVVLDTVADGEWVYASFNGETCRNAAFARVTSHQSANADL